ncbi:MAG: histidinol dehydrogenase [Alphaproteobacteria bacterium]|nr:histidinol dehydrogenase [Alphaproteobacteria bacterium]
MVHRLSTADPDFESRFEALLAAAREEDADVSSVVREIIARVRAEGDGALIDLTRRFERVDPQTDGLRLPAEACARALDALPADTRDALELAATRIRSYHARQRPEDGLSTDLAGVTLGHRWTAVDAAGLYVPGGRAVYPSSVLMNAIPAKVAGVRRIVMTVPTPDGVLNPVLLAAAAIAGVDEIYRVGGAQAVAALAYGTASIAPVDVIVGPGNAYVTEAKRQVFGQVGIDMLAGPSEILVLADGENDPAWIAADLLSQAEHDPSSQSVLITDSAPFAAEVERAVEAHLATLPRAAIARASWDRNGVLILVRDLAAEAPALVNRVAPEHLEIATADPRALLPAIRHAGAIFLGRYTPEAVGDYVGGPNHVLPTARSARFSSGLSVLTFLKRSSILGCDAEALRRLGPAVLRLAEEEGLGAHGLSVSIRLN